MPRQLINAHTITAQKVLLYNIYAFCHKSAFTQIEDGVYDDGGVRGRRELIAFLATSRARPFLEHVMFSCEMLNFWVALL